MKRQYKIAAIQTVSNHIVADNLKAAGELIVRAAGEGAELVALPEYFCIMGQKETDMSRRASRSRRAAPVAQAAPAAPVAPAATGAQTTAAQSRIFWPMPPRATRCG